MEGITLLLILIGITIVAMIVIHWLDIKYWGTMALEEFLSTIKPMDGINEKGEIIAVEGKNFRFIDNEFFIEWITKAKKSEITIKVFVNPDSDTKKLTNSIPPLRTCDTVTELDTTTEGLILVKFYYWNWKRIGLEIRPRDNFCCFYSGKGFRRLRYSKGEKMIEKLEKIFQRLQNDV